MNDKAIFNIVAMSTLIIMGIIMIIQGSFLMHLQKIDKLPEKAYVLGIVSISIGIMAFVFAALYALIG